MELLTAVGLSLVGSGGGVLIASPLLLLRDPVRLRLVPGLISYAVGTFLGVALLALVADRRAISLRALAIAARHRLTQTVRRTVQEVRQAHAAQAKLAAAAAQAREQLTPLQQQRVDLARAVYESGQSGITPLLLAELDLQKARLRSVQLELRAAVAAIELRRASGGDVVSFNIKTTTQKQ